MGNNKDALIREASRELQRAEDAVKRARQKLEDIQNLPDEPENGAIIRFDIIFDSYGSPYQYVAFRCAGYWWVTGQEHHKVKYSWIELVRFMRSGRAVRTAPYVVNGDVAYPIVGF
jgi:hypothetical protein